MKLKPVQYIPVLCLLVLLAVQCRQKHIPDVSGIHVKPVVERLDLALMQADTNDIKNTMFKLRREFPDFFDFYLSAISFVGHADDTSPRTLNGFKQFLTNKYSREMFDSIRKILNQADINSFENDFTNASRYYKYYFPNAPVPRAIFYPDGFSYAAVSISDSVVGLASEMYLGENFSIYGRLPEPLPKYQARLCKPLYMTRNVIYDLVSGIYPFVEDDKSMLDILLRNGKLLYATKLILPYAPDSVTTAFSQKQLKFCERNESSFWKFFIKENLLYNRNSREFGKYVQPGPECVTANCQPYNLGSWVGMRIVEMYMDNHPDVALPTLMKMENAQYLLQQSGYKP